MVVASTADQQVTLDALLEMQTRHQTTLQKVMQGHFHEVTELLQTVVASQPQAVGTIPVKAEISAAVCEGKATVDLEGVLQTRSSRELRPADHDDDNVRKHDDDDHVRRLDLSKEKANMEEMKKKLMFRSSTKTSVYNAQQQSCTRRKAGKLLNSKFFEYMMSLIIVANCVVIGMQADYSAQHIDEKDAPLSFRICELLFLFFFTFELALRLVVKGCYFFSCNNPDLRWNILDGFLVLAAITDEIANLAVEGSDVDVSAARLLRLLRLVRVNRMIKVLRFFKDLRIMILGIMSALTSLLWAGILLFMVIFVFALVFMQFVTDHLASNPKDRGGYLQNNFQSLPRVCYILFMSISGGVSWIEVSEPLVSISPMLGMLFIVYIAFSVFCVLNIITGVFVETATRHAYTDEEQVMLEEMEQRQQWVEEVKLAFSKADADGSEKLELEEFIGIAMDARVQFVMNKLGVDLCATKPESIFALFDQDSDGSINVDEFASAMQHVRGPARSIEVARLQTQTKSLSRNVDALGEQIGHVVAALTEMPRQRPSTLQQEATKVPEQPGCVVHPEFESHRNGEVAEELQ